MVHNSFIGQWRPRFPLSSKARRYEIDALALMQRDNIFKRLTVHPLSFRRYVTGAGASIRAAVLLSGCRRQGDGTCVREVHGATRWPCRAANIVEGQFNGAVAMGIGQALFENRDGRRTGVGDGIWALPRDPCA